MGRLAVVLLVGTLMGSSALRKNRKVKAQKAATGWTSSVPWLQDTDELLGTGATAHVYKAKVVEGEGRPESLSAGTMVAVRVDSMDPDGDECEALKKIDSVYVVKSYQFIPAAQNSGACVMELIQSGYANGGEIGELDASLRKNKAFVAKFLSTTIMAISDLLRVGVLPGDNNLVNTFVGIGSDNLGSTKLIDTGANGPPSDVAEACLGFLAQRFGAAYDLLNQVGDDDEMAFHIQNVHHEWSTEQLRVGAMEADSDDFGPGKRMGVAKKMLLLLNGHTLNEDDDEPTMDSSEIADPDHLDEVQHAFNELVKVIKS